MPRQRPFRFHPNLPVPGRRRCRRQENVVSQVEYYSNASSSSQEFPFACRGKNLVPKLRVVSLSQDLDPAKRGPPRRGGLGQANKQHAMDRRRSEGTVATKLTVRLSSIVLLPQHRSRRRRHGEPPPKHPAKKGEPAQRLLLLRRRSATASPPTPADSFNEEEGGGEGDAVPAPELQAPPTRSVPSRSLAVGVVQPDGAVRFDRSAIPGDGDAMVDCSSESSLVLSASASSQHYLRISDLRRLDSSLHSSLHGASDASRTPRTESPASTLVDGDEDGSNDVDDDGAVDQWLWLGCATNSPVAVNALAEVGWSVAMNRKLWTLASPAASSSSFSSSNQLRDWHEATFQPTERGRTDASPGTVPVVASCGELPVLVWTGKLHGLHRCDLPAVRAAALVPAAPRDLAELLVDSTRVKEYNPHSQGRVDLHVLQSALLEGGPYGGVTKVMRSTSKPPLVRKPLEFTSLLHARPIVGGGGGYLIVTRSVSSRSDSATPASASEILLSVNLLLPASGPPGRGPCTMVVTVNHIHSPLIPMMLAKRIGVQAASNFLMDLKQCVKAASIG